MTANLLKKSNSSDSGGFVSKIKKFFSKSSQKEYSNDFAKEKEVIAKYKARIEKENNVKQAKKTPIKFSIGNIKELAQNKMKGWQAPRMVATNLIQNEVVSYVDWSGRIRLLLVALLAPLLISVFTYIALVYLDVQARTKANILGAEIESLNKQVESAEKGIVEVDQFKGRLALIENLLDKHIYWTRLFVFLEKNILSDSTILGGFAGNTLGEYNFSIVSTAYSDVVEQIMVLRQNPLVESVEVSEARQGVVKFSESGQAAGVTYILKLKLDPRIFYNNE
ncbi:MAG: hypothetical protein U9Q85_02330 [Patescibacteria group bacterium]|nr:hypothetical protein [Patescibacteria group bacterium]